MNNNSQSGSAIIWILIAVGLFAALTYAVNSSNRGSTSFVSDEEARAYAGQIIQYGNEVKQAIKRLQLRGCSDTEISFDNAVVSGYSNSNAPSNKSCHVFDIAGGGLSWQSPPGDLSQKGLGQPVDGKYKFVTDNEWDGVGETCANATCSEVIMLYHFVDNTICEKINSILGYGSTPQDTDFGGQFFQGTHTYSLTIADEAGGSEAQGKKNACFNRINGVYDYIYAHVLIAR